MEPARPQPVLLAAARRLVVLRTRAVACAGPAGSGGAPGGEHEVAR